MSFRSDHHFKLWDFDVSHNKLLLRSPESPTQQYNIDIVFYGVEKLDLPTLIRDGLEIADPEASADNNGDPNLFRITADGQVHSIAALMYYVFKNRLDITESILDHFTGWGVTEEMGELIYQSTGPGRLSGVAGQASV